MKVKLPMAALLTLTMLLGVSAVGAQDPLQPVEPSKGPNTVPEPVKTTRVNLNSATLEELRSLPGVGTLYAQKILRNRPYISIEDLLTKGVVPPDIYKKIVDKITVFGG